MVQAEYYERVIDEPLPQLSTNVKKVKPPFTLFKCLGQNNLDLVVFKTMVVANFWSSDYNFNIWG